VPNNKTVIPKKPSGFVRDLVEIDASLSTSFQNSRKRMSGIHANGHAVGYVAQIEPVT